MRGASAVVLGTILTLSQSVGAQVQRISDGADAGTRGERGESRQDESYRHGLLLRASVGPGVIFVASRRNVINGFDQELPSTARAWGLSAEGEVGGSIARRIVLAGYVRCGLFADVRARVNAVRFDMDGLLLMTLGTGASFTYFPVALPGSYARFHAGAIGIDASALPFPEGGSVGGTSLRGPELSVSSGWEGNIVGDLWGGLGVNFAFSRLYDGPNSGTSILAPSLRATLTFF